MSAHERYDVADSAILFQDTWDEERETCPKCDSVVAETALKCPVCGAVLPHCVGICSACIVPECVGGKRRL